MKQIPINDLLEELKVDSVLLLENIDTLSRTLTAEQLKLTDGPGRWNTLQVLEHLSGYYRYYIPIMENKVGSSTTGGKKFFNPGILGGYFTRMMAPQNGKVKNKMKAVKNHSPSPNLNGPAVLKEFLDWQRKMILLIERSANVDLNSTRVPISLSKMIKLKLGDILMFIVAHNKRHWLQIEAIQRANGLGC